VGVAGCAVVGWDEPEPEAGKGGAGPLGSAAVKTPSSRSLSYTIMVPSACATRKRFELEGTQRTAVQGEEEMHPYIIIRQGALVRTGSLTHAFVQARIACSHGV
jgi:hypothetical protein